MVIIIIIPPSCVPRTFVLALFISLIFSVPHVASPYLLREKNAAEKGGRNKSPFAVVEMWVFVCCGMCVFVLQERTVCIFLRYLKFKKY